MLAPITLRLNPEQQQQVDGMWENVLTPLDRADHELLLGVVREYWLFQVGVDTLHFRSEKRLAHGRVVMEAECERVSPDADQFLITIYDDQGQTIRRERFGRKEIEAGDAMPGDDPPCAEAKLAARRARQARIEAATQPARAPAPAVVR